jgi:HEAT repeat protein
MASHLQPDHRADLLRSLSSRSVNVRRWAARALLQLGSATTVPLPRLRQALDDHDADTRLSIIRLLARVGPPALSVLVEATDHRDPAVRRHALWGLAQIGPPGASSAVPQLVRALRDSDLKVRLAAIWALGTIGPEASVAVPALVECFADRHRLVCRFTRWALRRTAAGNVPALADMLSHPDFAVRQEVAELLAHMDEEMNDSASTRVESFMVLVGFDDEPTDILA